MTNPKANVTDDDILAARKLLALVCHLEPWPETLAPELEWLRCKAERHDWDGMPEGWEVKPLVTLPQVRVTFSPQARVQKGGVWWARGDLNPDDLAITGT